MQSKATTIDEYLAALPDDRRAAISAVRSAINKHIPKGYQEGMQYGMIGWYVPHDRYPAGYHCDPSQPLPFAGLASQKNHMAIYLFCLYQDEGDQERFREAWAATGKKLDMGKSCVRFKKLDDVPLDVVGRAVKVPLKTFIARYEAVLNESATARSARRAAQKPAPATKASKQTNRAAAKAPSRTSTSQAGRGGRKKTGK